MAKAALAIRNIAQKFGFVEKAKTAEMAADHAEVLAGITQALDEAVRSLAELENKRETVLLDGDDFARYHGDLMASREMVETLQANRAEAQRRLDAAQAFESNKAVEEAARAVAAAAVPAYKQSLVKYYEAMRAVTEAGREVQENQRTIGRSNTAVKHGDHPDLVINRIELRDEVAESLGWPDVDGMPVRQGKGGDPDLEYGRTLSNTLTKKAQDEYAAWREQWTKANGTLHWPDHESDVDFNLRMQNWHTRRANSRDRTDPFKIAADEAGIILQGVGWVRE